MFPSTATYTAAPIDDGMAISSYNAPGASMAVTLPPIANVNPGWSMGFATDNGKGMTVTAPSGSIVLGGKFVSTVTLGAGNYEYLRVQSDGNNWRVVSSTRNTRLNMGFEPPPWPSNWLYPTASGYAATLGDNGNILSSYNTTAGTDRDLAVDDGSADRLEHRLCDRQRKVAVGTGQRDLRRAYRLARGWRLFDLG